MGGPSISHSSLAMVYGTEVEQVSSLGGVGSGRKVGELVRVMSLILMREVLKDFWPNMYADPTRRRGGTYGVCERDTTGAWQKGRAHTARRRHGHTPFLQWGNSRHMGHMKFAPGSFADNGPLVIHRFWFRLDDPIEEHARLFDVNDICIRFGHAAVEGYDLALEGDGCRAGLEEVVVLDICTTGVSTSKVKTAPTSSDMILYPPS
ncbi:hypothetical protein FIBSPDRAFT_1008533 [Athelia psychrophila]|uniref:Uncharacterized protein n=1 Tax=Athelia psychrophila TaxID=1759441 RepID=A0A167V6Z7_9AGAM|nr:hypothetical protein FIBSPDRAFT_1008533 [Fibularhizoctonia sp. CBS 109695]